MRRFLSLFVSLVLAAVLHVEAADIVYAPTLAGITGNETSIESNSVVGIVAVSSNWVTRLVVCPFTNSTTPILFGIAASNPGTAHYVGVYTNGVVTFDSPVFLVGSNYSANMENLELGSNDFFVGTAISATEIDLHIGPKTWPTNWPWIP